MSHRAQSACHMALLPARLAWTLTRMLTQPRCAIRAKDLSRWLTTACQCRRYSRMSQLYIPMVTSDVSTAHAASETVKSVNFLHRAGFIRQSSAGIYTLLPLALRVVEKIERIIEREMHAVGACKIALPNLLSATQWKRSGRWESTGSELWRIYDRKDTEMLLAPTHEEEITTLISQDILSERALPIKVYQIGRKYRDEARPRGGLLRAREFLMKDLYTFDPTLEAAELSYSTVTKAYRRIFDAIGVPYLRAEADTGNIGGMASHEYHFTCNHGEDTLIVCQMCRRASNIELASSLPRSALSYIDANDCNVYLCEDPNARALHAIIYRKIDALSQCKIAKVLPGTKPVHDDHSFDQYNTISVVLDTQAAQLAPEDAYGLLAAALAHQSPDSIWASPPLYEVKDVRVAKPGERCLACGGQLAAVRAIEVGHTFLLGDRYSKSLGAAFARTKQAVQQKALFQMGCHGIGISRLVNAIAETSFDEDGLRWPSSVSPFTVCVITNEEEVSDLVIRCLQAAQIHDILLDDRYDTPISKRLVQAKMSGITFVVTAGKAWRDTKHLILVDRWRAKEIKTTLLDLIDEVKGCQDHSWP